MGRLLAKFIGKGDSRNAVRVLDSYEEQSPSNGSVPDAASVTTASSRKHRNHHFLEVASTTHNPKQFRRGKKPLLNTFRRIQEEWKDEQVPTFKDGYLLGVPPPPPPNPPTNQTITKQPETIPSAITEQTITATIGRSHSEDDTMTLNSSDYWNGSSVGVPAHPSKKASPFFLRSTMMFGKARGLFVRLESDMCSSPVSNQEYQPPPSALMMQYPDQLAPNGPNVDYEEVSKCHESVAMSSAGSVEKMKSIDGGTSFHKLEDDDATLNDDEIPEGGTLPAATADEVDDDSKINESSCRSKADSTEFRQFVFDKDFSRIETVSVEKSDPGGMSDSFLSAAAQLTAHLHKQSQENAYMIEANKEEKKEEIQPVVRETKKYQNRPNTSTTMFPVRTQKGLVLPVSSSEFTVLTEESMSGSSNPFLELKSSSCSSEDDDSSSDPFGVGILTEVDDTLWESDMDPFVVKHYSSNSASKAIADHFKKSKSADDALISSIRDNASKSIGLHSKPDPSPRGRGIRGSVSESQKEKTPVEMFLFETKTRNKNSSPELVPANWKEFFSPPHPRMEMTRVPPKHSSDTKVAKSQYDFKLPGPQKSPSGIPSTAIMGSMLFRRAHSESTMSLPDKGQRHSTDETSDNLPIPPKIQATATMDSSVSSITEEASSFYCKNFQAWNQRASHALDNYHAARKAREATRNATVAPKKS